MLKKIIALALLCLMIAVTAFSQTNLSYCLCARAIVLNQCPCTETPEFSKYSSKIEKAHTEARFTNCGSCMVDLSVQLDSYISAATTDQTSKAVQSDLETHSQNTELTFVSSKPPISDQDTRGSPAPLQYPSAVPLFLRHSVFLV